MKSVKNTITVHNKKYEYVLRPSGKKATFVECAAANISQEFLNEDIPALLVDLPGLILAEKKYQSENDQVIRFRISSDDKKRIEIKAHEGGFRTVSGFLRHLALGS